MEIREINMSTRYFSRFELSGISLKGYKIKAITKNFQWTWMINGMCYLLLTWDACAKAEISFPEEILGRFGSWGEKWEKWKGEGRITQLVQPIVDIDVLSLQFLPWCPG